MNNIASLAVALAVYSGSAAAAVLAPTGAVGPQSIAVNPKNPNLMVTTYALFGDTRLCLVRTSINGGRTWYPARALPMPPNRPNCDVTEVTWSPDGSRVYAAYSYDIDAERGVLVSSSTDRGATWSSPTIGVVYPDDGYHLSSIRLSTPLRPVNSGVVYLLSETTNPAAYHSDFNVSSDRGQTWTMTKQDIITSYYTSQRPSISGGLKGNVIVAWGEYHYGVESIDHDQLLDNQIFVKFSGDYGHTFHDDFIAVPNTHGDTAVAFGHRGTAHILYTDQEYGKPSYVYSAKAPYTKWSAPVTINDVEATAYSTPALAVSACRVGSSILHAMWMDNRLSTANSSYAVFYSSKVAQPSAPWSPNIQVSEAPMPTDFNLSLGVTAAGGAVAAVWGHSDYTSSGTSEVFVRRGSATSTCDEGMQ